MSDVNKQIAETIYHQLGGNAFVAMTGAKNFFYDGPALTFKLPSNFAKNGINQVKVSLNAMDSYDVVFNRIRGHRVNEVTSHTGIYSDGLCELFREETGLELSIPCLVRG